MENENNLKKSPAPSVHEFITARLFHPDLINELYSFLWFELPRSREGLASILSAFDDYPFIVLVVAVNEMYEEFWETEKARQDFILKCKTLFSPEILSLYRVFSKDDIVCCSKRIRIDVDGVTYLGFPHETEEQKNCYKKYEFRRVIFDGETESEYVVPEPEDNLWNVLELLYKAKIVRQFPGYSGMKHGKWHFTPDPADEHFFNYYREILRVSVNGMPLVILQNKISPEAFLVQETAKVDGAELFRDLFVGFKWYLEMNTK